MPFANENTAKMAWYSAKFKFDWPLEISEADLSKDLLIAHAVIKPALDLYRNNIPLWRFHRRAILDSTGHEFSFIFYSTYDTAQNIFDSIQKSTVLNTLINKRVIIQVNFNSPTEMKASNISDTSDPKWSESMKRNWPVYATGCSELWLGLISDSVPTKGIDKMNTTQLLELYKDTDQNVSALWKEEGGHAFFHHLNAIFGYEPISIKKLVF